MAAACYAHAVCLYDVYAYPFRRAGWQCEHKEKHKLGICDSRESSVYKHSYTVFSSLLGSLSLCFTPLDHYPLATYLGSSSVRKSTRVQCAATCMHREQTPRDGDPTVVQHSKICFQCKAEPLQVKTHYRDISAGLFALT